MMGLENDDNHWVYIGTIHDNPFIIIMFNIFYNQSMIIQISKLITNDNPLGLNVYTNGLGIPQCQTNPDGPNRQEREREREPGV